VLAVMREVRLGSTWCKVKIPTSPEGIAERLKMYESTGPHHHRDGTLGPPVPETMAKLFGLMAEAKRNKTFVHVDPDDVASRLPIMMRKLKETEAAYSFYMKGYIVLKNIAYLRTKLVGVVVGAILPILSVLFILAARAPRHKAFRVGVVAGHSLDMLILTILALISALNPLPAGCSGLFDCFNNAPDLAKQNPESGGMFDGLCYDATEDGLVENCTPDTIYSSGDDACLQCFCDNYLEVCDTLQGDKQAYLFIGILFLVASVALIGYARYLDRKIGRKKSMDIF